MATGFTRARASAILAGQIKSTTYVALSTTTPTVTGGNFTEPPTSAGYVRKALGVLDTSITAQIANKDYVFIFEALSDCGTITHVGLSDSLSRGSEVFLIGELATPIKVGTGYVPLIRPWKLKVGLDKAALEAYPNET